MKQKYNPHGWYKMRNEKMVEQLLHGIGTRSIAEYWGLNEDYVKHIIDVEIERRSNGRCV